MNPDSNNNQPNPSNVDSPSSNLPPTYDSSSQPATTQSAPNQPAQAEQSSFPQPSVGKNSKKESSNNLQQRPAIQAQSNPNSTQNTLEIAEIRDGIVIMNDGSFRAVVAAKSINFDLMSAQERESVEYAYQNFLNSLYFDTQIVIRSRKVDMRPYLDKLNKIRTEQDNMLLALLMEDYIYYIEQLVEQTNIMSKKFYVTVPYYQEVSAKQAVGQTQTLFKGLVGKKQQQLIIDEATLEKAKTELQNRVQSIMNGLLQLGVQAEPLDTQELIELYYDVYNPDTATRQPLAEFEDLSSVIVSKGEGEAKQPNLEGEES